MENVTLSIFVPCLNEESNIKNTLNNIKEAIINISYEILIVDDGSKDNTIKIVEKFANDNSNLKIKIFHNKKNHGIGFNYFATANDAIGKYYMLINGDNVEPVNAIKKLLDNIGEADMVIPYFGKNDKRVFFRRIISKLFTMIINIITFNSVKYYNGPVLHLLENVKLYRSNAFGYGYQAELITSLISLKKTFVHIEIDNVDRQTGKSKAFTFHNILSVGNSVIRIFLNQIAYIMKKIFGK